MSILSKLFSSNANIRPEMPPAQPAEEPAPAAAPEPAIHYERGGLIVVYLAASQGDALNQLALDFVEPFREHCRDILIVDLRLEHPLDRLNSDPMKGVWFVLSFFGLGQNISIASGDRLVNLWDAVGVPFVRIYGDSPAYFPDAHVQTHANSINFYAHPEHFQFYRRWFNSKGLSLQMTPIRLDRLPAPPADLSRKIAGKTIVFPKNGNCPKKLLAYWRTSLPPAIAKALESLAEELASPALIDHTVDITDRVLQYFSSTGLELKQHKPLTFFLTAQLDDYLRRVKSTMIANALLDFPIVVRGANWGHVDFTGKRARLDTDADYASTRQIIDDALAILDMSPNIENMHDRVQRAAGRYTAFLTNRSKYFTERFDNYKAFTFEFNPDSIRERVAHALSNPQETVEMGLLLGEKMKQMASDESYAAGLIDAVDICALSQGRPEGTQDFVIYPPELL